MIKLLMIFTKKDLFQYIYYSVVLVEDTFIIDDVLPVIHYQNKTLQIKINSLQGIQIVHL